MQGSKLIITADAHILLVISVKPSTITVWCLNGKQVQQDMVFLQTSNQSKTLTTSAYLLTNNKNNIEYTLKWKEYTYTVIIIS